MSAPESDARAAGISPAARTDLASVLALLADVNLPAEGVDEYFDHFLVARDPDARLVGVAGVELHGATALLRSVAVAPDLQRSGLGSRLTEAALEHAMASGASEAVLLTTTAGDYFARRFGFARADRADYAERLAASPEWALARCSSAAFLRLGL